MTETRICANRYCRARFTARRPHHVFCHKECRMQDWIRREVAEAGKTRLNGSRTHSRDGSGTKLYLLPAELDELTIRFRAEPASERLMQKVREAKERIEGRNVP